MNSPTPAIVTQSAVRRLPRLPLLLLCLAYLLPGTLLREPWRGADMTAYGYMQALANGASDWWAPRLLDLPPETQGLLPYWLGAWSIRGLGGLIGPELAARLPFLALLVVTLVATWYGTYALARSARAQPVAFAFGGEAQPADYARAIADGALLAMLACLGLAQPGHEGTAYVSQLAGVAVLFFGLANAVRHPAAGLAGVVAGWLLMAFSGAPLLAMWLLGGGWLALVLDRRLGQPDAGDTALLRRSWLTGVAAFGVAGGLLMLALGRLHLSWALPTQDEWDSHLRLHLWFLWPAWPLALWTLWRWRNQWCSRVPPRHLSLPIWFTLVISTAAWGLSPADRTLMLALPAVAVLAAWALPTLNRSVSALIDWFTLLFFSISAIAIWVIWLSTQTGIPAKPAANVAKLAPTFVPSFSLAALVIALAATIAWFALVAWRVGRHRPALWKSLVLPAGGTTLCWLLLLTLWLPMLNHARNDAAQVRQIAEAVSRHEGATACVLAHPGLERSQIAAVQVYTSLALQRGRAEATSCRWLLSNTPLSAEDALGGWQEQLRALRSTGRRHYLYLYQRTAQP